MTATLAKDSPAPDDDDTTEAPAGKSRVVPALVAMLVVGAALTALILWVVDDSQQPAVDPVEYTVAADTGTGLTTGDAEDVVPEIIRLEPNQELVLVNNDWQPHTLGDLAAEQGDTVRISYPSEGRHVTGTTLRSDGRVTILVEDTTP